MNVGKYVPVDVAELMLARVAFEGYCDVEGSAGGYGAADSRHDDDGDVVEGDVLGGFWDKHEALV